MLQSDIYYDKILAGMWNNFLAIGLFFIFWHVLDKCIKAMTAKKALILGLILAFLILIHLYTAIVAFILLSIYLAPYMADAYKNKTYFRRSLFYSCTIPLVAIIASSYYLHSLVITRDYYEKFGKAIPLKQGFEWWVKSFFGPLRRVNGISGFMINLPVLTRVFFGFLGVYVLFLKKEGNQPFKRSLKRLLWFLAACTLFFIMDRFEWWQKIPLITALQPSRFFVYIQLGMYIFAAYGIARFLNYFKNKNFIITACVVPLVFSAFFHYAYIARDATKTLEQSPRMQNVYKVWDWVDANIPPGKGRVVYQNTIGNMDDPIFKRSDVFALSGVFTKIPQIGVSRPASSFPQEKYMRNDHGNIFGRDVDKADAAFVRDMMDDFNAGYIVSVEPDLASKLDESGLFHREEAFGSFSIFRLKDFTNGWINFKKDADYKTTTFENQRVTFDIWNKSVNNQAFIKVAYHPFWKARLNGRVVEIKQDKYSLMGIPLPEKGIYELILEFDSFNPFWVAVSLIALTGTGLIIGFNPMKKSVHGRGSGAADA
jgi:hypothetical protein